MKYHVEFDIDFKRNTDPGLYIALEGIDGCGKTTQVEKLYEYFDKLGREVVRTREPRREESIVGKLINAILKDGVQIPPIAFQYLFTADREMHHEELIKPALKAGKVVVSDRCFWSAIPYGILDKGGNLSESSGEHILVAQSILSMYHQFTVPDYTFYLDVPVEIAMERLLKVGGTQEIYEHKEKLEETIGGYFWLLKQFPKEITTLDGTKSVGEVTEKILQLLAVDDKKERLQKRGETVEERITY